MKQFVLVVGQKEHWFSTLLKNFLRILFKLSLYIFFGFGENRSNRQYIQIDVS